MIEAWLERAVGVVWNYPVVGLCLFAGLFFTIRLGFIQLRGFFHALALLTGRYDDPNETGHITHFQALSAALSGTIGLGNIAGVAIAISVGGPGAVFWMWIVAFLGMGTKFAECTLGTLYRHEDRYGNVRGGPMHYITKGLGKRWRPLAVFYAICATIGSFGFADMFQSNQVAEAFHKNANIPYWLTGLVMAGLVGMTIIGGIQRIGHVTSRIVPFMCGIYLLGALSICVISIDRIPDAFAVIMSDAFTGWAAAGGVVGMVIITAVRRAVFSNEAGLGSASIAHAAVKTNYPVREGIVASLGPFIDTAVVCTGTALVIILSGHFGEGRYQEIEELKLTSENQHQFTLSDGWKLVGEEIPEDQDELRDYRTSPNALHFTSQGPVGKATLAAIPVVRKHKLILSGPEAKGVNKVAHGIRFASARQGAGAFAVDILTEDGDILATLPVTPEAFSLELTDETDATIPFLSINGTEADGDWHHQLISFSRVFRDRIKSDIAGLGNLRLQFRASGTDAVWYVDGIQSVREMNGAELTIASFDEFFDGFGTLIVTIAIFFFAFSTMVTWSFYGETAISYVFGRRAITPFRWMFVIAVYIGAVNKLGPVLNFSDLMAGLMVIPNFIAIIFLSRVVARESKKYFKLLKAGEFNSK